MVRKCNHSTEVEPREIQPGERNKKEVLAVGLPPLGGTQSPLSETIGVEVDQDEMHVREDVVERSCFQKATVGFHGIIFMVIKYC